MNVWVRIAALVALSAGLVEPTCAEHQGSDRPAKLAMLAVHHKVPAIYSGVAQVKAGGLVSYATNFPETYRQVGVYTGRVLKGDKPSSLPVLQPTKFELDINLQAARCLA
jgi:putative tryptophan/tyrosine transport system substrate-binding protein